MLWIKKYKFLFLLNNTYVSRRINYICIVFIRYIWKKSSILGYLQKYVYLVKLCYSKWRILQLKNCLCQCIMYSIKKDKIFLYPLYNAWFFGIYYDDGFTYPSKFWIVLTKQIDRIYFSIFFLGFVSRFCVFPKN